MKRQDDLTACLRGPFLFTGLNLQITGFLLTLEHGSTYHLAPTLLRLLSERFCRKQSKVCTEDFDVEEEYGLVEEVTSLPYNWKDVSEAGLLP